MKVVNKNYKKYQQKIQEGKLFDDEEVLMEANEKKSDDGLTDEELREISLDIAIDISKLMEKVSPDDILKISRDVAKYIKFHVIGEEYSTELGEEQNEEEKPVDAEPEEDFDILDDEDFDFSDDEEEKEEEPEEFEIEDDEEEPEEANEKGDVIPNEFII